MSNLIYQADVENNSNLILPKSTLVLQKHPQKHPSKCGFEISTKILTRNNTKKAQNYQNTCGR